MQDLGMVSNSTNSEYVYEFKDSYQINAYVSAMDKAESCKPYSLPGLEEDVVRE